ncbi:MAG TPA: carboxymuconolactone decarboxylase family protein [Candidatus Acidoferrales bacterium]|nr:carboxymuconolactone decarboxylase family protein [Candidatus Acidoferrales bacterium]
MADRLEEFQKFRAELNEEILNCGHLGIKRFFALDHQAYEPGALPRKTKELLGLVASSVLRCDDCITYHLVGCGEVGWKREEVIDALNVALIVGGSIAIPHVRRAFARMREIEGLKPYDFPGGGSDGEDQPAGQTSIQPRDCPLIFSDN